MTSSTNRRGYLAGAAGTVLALISGKTYASPTTKKQWQDSNDAKHTCRGDTVQAKVDLHSHLFRGGGQAMADRYAELGFDVLVGTDHSYDLDKPGGHDSEEVGDYTELDFPGPILNGIELSDAVHVNVIKSETEMIKQINHPMRYDMDAAEINALAGKVGADLVEVTNHARKLAAYPSVADAVEDLDPTPTITSDAHAPSEIGPGYVVVDVPKPLTGDNVIRALKAGEYSLGGDLW